MHTAMLCSKTALKRGRGTCLKYYVDDCRTGPDFFAIFLKASAIFLVADSTTLIPLFVKVTIEVTSQANIMATPETTSLFFLIRLLISSSLVLSFSLTASSILCDVMLHTVVQPNSKFVRTQFTPLCELFQRVGPLHIPFSSCLVCLTSPVLGLCV